MTRAPALSLSTTWTPAKDGESLAYGIRLTNDGDTPLADFTLCFSGPARIDPHATIENGRLVKRLSNHTEVAPPEGFVLAPGASWTVTARGLSYGLRHWSDGANSGYVALADGSTITLSTAPTQGLGFNGQLLKGSKRFPVPARAPVPVSIVPWPKSVETKGARTVPPGLDLQPQGDDAGKAAMAFTSLVADLFPVEGIVRPASEAGMPVAISHKAGLGAEAYELSFAENAATVAASTRAGMLYGLITLGQILRGARLHPQTFVFPTGGMIADEPGFVWRGSHLDVARQFYAGAEVSRFLKIMAWNKMNRFHWHLSRGRGLARRDRRLSATDRGRRLARSWPRPAAAAGQRPAADRRLLFQSRHPPDRRSGPGSGNHHRSRNRRARPLLRRAPVAAASARSQRNRRIPVGAGLPQ